MIRNASRDSLARGAKYKPPCELIPIALYNFAPILFSFYRRSGPSLHDWRNIRQIQLTSNTLIPFSFRWLSIWILFFTWKNYCHIQVLQICRYSLSLPHSLPHSLPPFHLSLFLIVIHVLFHLHPWTKIYYFEYCNTYVGY